MSVKNQVLLISFLFSSTIMGSHIEKKNNKIDKPQTPLVFEENKGQFDEKVKYLSKGKGYNIALGLHPVIELFRYEPVQVKQSHQDLSNVKSSVKSFEQIKIQAQALAEMESKQTELKLVDYAIFQMQIVGSNNQANIIAQDKVTKKSNYLVGKKSNWTTNVENFSSIRYQDILQGVDVVYYGNDGRLEYDFIVKPKAKVTDIKLNFNGVEDVSINEVGQLVLKLGEQEIIQNAPITYQLDTNGNRLPVESKYINNAGTIGFSIGEYNQDQDLIIDPVLEYSRYYGGSSVDTVRGLDVDSNDNIYMVGSTASPNLATTGAYQEVNNTPIRAESVSFPYCQGCTDAPDLDGTYQVERAHIYAQYSGGLYITKFSLDGTNILWSTYFTNDNIGLNLGANSVAVSASGEVAFGLDAGYGANALSEGLPTVNSTQVFSATDLNVYIAKLNTNGDDLIFSTYLNIAPASGGGWLRGLDVADDGSVVAVGFAADYSFNGGVAAINFPEINPLPNHSCALDGSTYEDISDGWVIRFDTTGTATFSSCMGGSMKNGSYLEGFRGVKIGPNGHLYVLGYSAMTDFPVVNPIQATQSFAGIRDVTVTEIDHTNSEIVFSTYLGPIRNDGKNDNYPIDIDVDASGNIFVTGTTSQSGWPTVNAFQPNLNYASASSLVDIPGSLYSNNNELYLTKINPSTSSIEFSTYLGGSLGEDGLNTMTLDAEGNSYIFAITASVDYPVTNELQTSMLGTKSAVVSKFSPLGALVYSSYHGGTDNALVQTPGGIAVNSLGKIILASKTQADDFNLVGSVATRSGDFDATLTIINQSGDIDTDGDGVIDSLDAFVSDNTEWLDTDSNLVGDNADTDDDGDLVLDVNDRFPLDATEAIDSDNDGVGDVADVFPNDPTEYFDLDGNGLGDFGESDADKDGVENGLDFRPYNPSEWFDFDNDGIGNNADLDDDGDGLADTIDIAPTNSDDPVITFNTFDATRTYLYKSPLPSGFSSPETSDGKWTSSSDQQARALSNLKILDNQTSTLQYDEVFEAGNLSFKYKVDSEENFDILTFSIDGALELTASGEVDWTEFMIPISAGAHTLTWTYAKNGSNSVGFDAVWIDDLTGSPPGAVDLVTTVVNDDGIIVSGGTANYTITVYNNSTAPTAMAHMLLTAPTEFSNVVWECTTSTSYAGTSCNTAYGTAKSQTDVGVNRSGTGDIDTLFDLGARETITFKLTADVDVIAEDATVTVPASVSVDPNIREDNTQDNTTSTTSFSGIFANGFEG